MCIILDVNSFSDLRNTVNEDMKPVWYWLENKNGKIVYSSTEKFRSEWEAGGGYELMIELLYPGSRSSLSVRMGWEQAVMELQRMGKFKLVSAEAVQAKAEALEQTGELRSDDPHIIALAIIANVTVLVSNDRALHADFKNPKLVGGRVYQTKTHRHLLRGDTCP